MNINSDVSIVATGITKFGKRNDRSYRELFGDAVKEAFSDCRNLNHKEVDGFFLGTAMPERYNEQSSPASMLSEYAGLKPKVMMRVERACATGSLAARQAYLAIKSGLIDTALVVGVEKMNQLPNKVAVKTLCLPLDITYEGINGNTAYSSFALSAMRHMYEYGTTSEQLASVSVKSHANGAMNPKAQIQKRVTLEEVLTSPMISSPLTLLMCSPITDGAAALIMCRSDIANKFSDAPIKILASAEGMEPAINVNNAQSLTSFLALKKAAEEAFRLSHLTPKDIDIAELHDCFAIAEVIEYEDIGFCKKGEGGKFAQDGETAIGGSIPVNTSGGLKSKGHPQGATGVAQLCEVTQQLRGESGARQVNGAEIGLTQNLGGAYGANQIVHILGR